MITISFFNVFVQINRYYLELINNHSIIFSESKFHDLFEKLEGFTHKTEEENFRSDCQKYQVNDSLGTETFFLCSQNTAIQISHIDSIVKKYRILLKSYVVNLLEFTKHVIKFRPGFYQTIRCVDLAYSGFTYINFNNGTVVVEHKNFVDKFYFKDIPYFTFLYKKLSSFQANFCCFENEGFLLVRQKKYQAFDNDLLDSKGFSFARSILTNLNQAFALETKLNPYFSVGYKVKQLFKLYSAQHASMDIYLNICDQLEAKASPFRKTLCHGDFWKENILLEGLDNRSVDSVNKVRDVDVSSNAQNTLEKFENLALIDYDKLIYFCEPYDYVYYYLMLKTNSSKIHLKNFLKNLDKYVFEISFFFDKNQIKAPDFSNFSVIRVCVFLFVFLKLLEQDLQYKKYGKNACFLNYFINIL